MLRKIFPHPYLTLLMVLVWLALMNSVSLGGVVFGTLLGIAIPAITAVYWPDRPQIKNPLKAVSYFFLVMWDIVIANISVAKIVLFMPNSKLQPAWITVPLDLRQPDAITLLAGTITMSPATVTSDLSADGRALLIHCLHAPDPAAVVDEIKTRYEARIKEIFA